MKLIFSENEKGEMIHSTTKKDLEEFINNSRDDKFLITREYLHKEKKVKVYIHFDNYANIISVFETRTDNAEEMHLLLFKIMNACIECHRR